MLGNVWSTYWPKWCRLIAGVTLVKDTWTAGDVPAGWKRTSIMTACQERETPQLYISYLVQTWYKQIIKPVLCKPLEDNEEMNHSQNRFGKNNPISSHDSLTGFVYKGEGWALAVLWMLSHITCSKARWRDTTGCLMNPKHFLKAYSESS